MTTTCGNCQHYDTKPRYPLSGYGNCALELGPLRVAKYFSPEAPCNKSKFTPATTPQQKESK